MLQQECFILVLLGSVWEGSTFILAKCIGNGIHYKCNGITAPITGDCWSVLDSIGGTTGTHPKGIPWSTDDERSKYNSQ